MIDKQKMYGTNDIQIIDVRRDENCVCNGREYYECAVKVGDKDYSAKWYPSDEKYLSENVTARGVQNLLVIYVDGRKNSVLISDSVINEIEEKILIFKEKTKWKMEVSKSAS